MTTIPLAEARANLSRIVDEASRTHERIEITRNGTRAAVVLGAGDYDALLETIDILSDAALVQDLRAALDELENGDQQETPDVLEGLSPARRGGR